MEPFNELLLPLVSLTGLLFGIILSFIAPEELTSGKKYFMLFKQSLFVIISGIIIFSFLQSRQFYLVLLFALSAAALFFLDLKLKKKKYRRYYVLHYFLFLLPYFLNHNVSFRLILISLIFLYGFPLGTLLKMGSSK
ncbi:MAG: hypothetical protein AABW48_01865 [Nanoarchaeota archaeon]